MSIKAGIKGSLDGDHLLASSYTKSTTSTADAMLSWSQTSYPPDGLTFTFTPPEDCQAPSAQPTNLNIKSTSTAVSGTFTKSETADHYLVLLNNSANLTALPENNVFYAAGDTLGDARVLAYTAPTRHSTVATFLTAPILIIFMLLELILSACMVLNITPRHHLLVRQRPYLVLL
jgi:hypothetical protein